MPTAWRFRIRRTSDKVGKSDGIRPDRAAHPHRNTYHMGGWRPTCSEVGHYESATTRESRRHEGLAQSDRGRPAPRDRPGYTATPGVRPGARCGLRSHEVLDVTPEDVVDTDAGTVLGVRSGKGEKYLVTPFRVIWRRPSEREATFVMPRPARRFSGPLNQWLVRV